MSRRATRPDSVWSRLRASVFLAATSVAIGIALAAAIGLVVLLSAIALDHALR